MNARVVLWSLIIVGAVAATFFTVRVQAFKAAQAEARRTVDVKDGDPLLVGRVMDGDELEGDVGGKRIIVRILGIKSFDPTTDDPRTRAIAGDAVRYLEGRLSGTAVILRFDELKWDDDKRLLAYLQVGDSDVGEDMVRSGLTLVYTRYPFSREGRYRKAQRAARETRRGVWGIPVLVERALTLDALWIDQRGKGRQ